jgi:hypothetical protein
VHGTLAHGHEETQISILIRLLKRLVILKSVLEQSGLLEGICRLSKEITVIVELGSRRGVCWIQPLKMTLQ